MPQYTNDNITYATIEHKLSKSMQGMQVLERELVVRNLMLDLGH